jgi:cytochrome c biogenesis protein CcmG, thiol:disulfide interchange protein DsbE
MTTKKKISPLVFLPPLLFLGFAVLFMVGLVRENPNELPSMVKGNEIPELMITPLGDLPMVTREQLMKPEVKLVNFWASWCAPCRVEHPNLLTMQSMGIPIYGINYKDEPENGLGFLEELTNPFIATSADEKGRTGIEWGVYGLPETFIVDANGIVTYRHVGAITKRIMESVILPEIEKARAGVPVKEASN